MRAWLVISLTLVLVSAGCDSESGKPELRVVFWAGLEEMKIEEANVAEFQRLNPEVAVKLESIPDNYLEKLVTAFAADRPPDVLLLDSVVIPHFVDSGVLMDLAPRLAGIKEFSKDSYFPEVWRIAARQAEGGEEQVYALPKDFTPLVVYYNKRTFDAAGVAYPVDGWNWADFRATALALTYPAPGSELSVPYSERRYGTLIYTWPGYNIVWFWQAGGDVLSPNGTRATGYLDSPASQRAMEYFTGLVFDGLAPDATAREALGGQSFQTGQVGMSISGHWAMPGYRRAAEKSAELLANGEDVVPFDLNDIGVVGLPQEAARVNVIYESGWAVSQATAHPELAVELACYLSGEEAQRRRAEMGLAISANQSVAAEFAADDPREQVFLAEVQYGRAPWGTRIQDWSVVEDLVSEGTERVLLGYDSVAEALERTAELIDAELSMFRASEE